MHSFVLSITRSGKRGAAMQILDEWWSLRRLTQSWITTVLGLYNQKSSLWDLAMDVDVEDEFGIGFLISSIIRQVAI